jgi:hypothetical protein
MKDNIYIPKSFLSSGKDYQITKSLKVKHPTVQEVLDIDKDYNGLYSEDMYYSFVSVFMCDPYDYMVYLDDKGIDYEKISKFDLFVLLYNDIIERYEKEKKEKLSIEDYEELFYNNIYFRAFRFFLGKDYFIIAKDENGKTVVGDFDDRTVMIDEEIFSLISEFIKEMNGIHFEDRINPDDDFAKQILIEDERKRIKKLEKKKPDEKHGGRLGNLLSAITWASNGGITPFNRNKLHMYDLVEGISRTDKLLNFNHTMTGLYSGCIDKKDINMQKISWQV